MTKEQAKAVRDHLLERQGDVWRSAGFPDISGLARRLRIHYTTAQLIAREAVACGEFAELLEPKVVGLPDLVFSASVALATSQEITTVEAVARAVGVGKDRVSRAFRFLESRKIVKRTERHFQVIAWPDGEPFLLAARRLKDLKNESN